MQKIKAHVAMAPNTLRDLRVLAAQHGLRQGETLAGLLPLASVSPPLLVARAMASADTTAGCLIEPGSEAGHIAQAALGGDVPQPEDDGAVVAEDF